MLYMMLIAKLTFSGWGRVDGVHIESRQVEVSGDDSHKSFRPSLSKCEI